MFCPEDGTEVTISLESMPRLWYHPCPQCGACWVYNGEDGTYSLDSKDTEVCAICNLPFKSHFRGEVCERKENPIDLR
ncbi:hypothetical protein LCGC14_2545520 [marine sediment metagenome]|uniref:Uncharacterized protein n=1 Tax=marine sediment metagenome TaxID=412755 RepID=A0A0F9D0V8_9ZZZZ